MDGYHSSAQQAWKAASRLDTDGRGETGFLDCVRTGCSVLYTHTLSACAYNCCRKCVRRKEEEERGEEEEERGGVEEDVDTQVMLMKRRIRFHFMNPFEKWAYRGRRRFPWKLLLQLLNVVLVVTQLCVFASTKFELTDFVNQNRQTLVQMFINNIADPDDIATFNSPVSTVYTFDDLFDQIAVTSMMYYNLGKGTVAPYGRGWRSPNGTEDNVMLGIKHYKNGTIDADKRHYNVSGGLDTKYYTIYERNCTGVSSDCTGDNRECCDLYLEQINRTRIKHDFGRVVQVKMNLNVSALYLGGVSPDCILFMLEIRIENDLHSGSMPVSLDIKTKISTCTEDGASMPDTGLYVDNRVTVLDCLVILSAIVSTVLCGRSLTNSFRFQRRASKFFFEIYEYRLKWRDSLPLFNMWFVGVIASNVLAMLGSVMKIILTYWQDLSSLDTVDAVSIIIGLATFGQIAGLLRFLSYLESYNILLITMRVALPSVLRFVLCGGVLYVAFMLCGWLVLGPYHAKFQNPWVTSECLFSLMNGDDIFFTFKRMNTSSQLVYAFSQMYLYIFISLFIYVVLNVFISLIADTYETLNEHWKQRSNGFLVDYANGRLDAPVKSEGDGDQSRDISNDDTAPEKELI
ncbi:hypothetical protein EMCRGX_G007720 [Ephydatia muelleri]